MIFFFLDDNQKMRHVFAKTANWLPKQLAAGLFHGLGIKGCNERIFEEC
jgi:hypothetical protein